MAPKRSIKSVCVTNNNIYNNLTLDDVLCPICRSILIEPVTLPCNHSFCSSCFDGTVANTNLVCPLCRIRIGSWLRRSSKKDNKLVNIALWDAIQKSFPTEVQNKLSGNDEYHVEEVPRRLTVPGEIRREYEIQKAKEMLELHKEREAETKASEAYIQKLKDEEEHQEKIHQENLRLSEQVAKKLAQEYAYDPGPSSSKVNLVPPASSKKQLSIDKALKRMNENKVTITVQQVVENPTKKYVCKVLCHDQNKSFSKSKNKSFDKASLLNWKIKDKLKRIITEGEASDSNDSITSECRYFKPIDQRFSSAALKVPLIKVPAIIASANTVIIGPPKGEIRFNHAEVDSAFVILKAPITDVCFIEKHQSLLKSKPQISKVDISDTVITELMQSPKESSPKAVYMSPKKRDKCKTLEIFETSPSTKKYETRNNMNNNQNSLLTTVEKCSNSSEESDPIIFTTPSKRKRLRSSPLLEKAVPVKKSKICGSTNESGSPLLGFSSLNLTKVDRKTNGAITVEAVNIHSTYEGDGIAGKLKQLQEEEDFKFAKKLHEELNSRSRYSTRNSISVNNNNNNMKKASARQVTLKEMISHAVNKA